MSAMTTRETPTNDALAGVPGVIGRYFELDADRAIDSIVALFTDHAQVVDEGEARHGRSAIREWQIGPASKYTYTTQVLRSEELDANLYAVTGRLTGNFPGGVAELRWTFKLAGDRIEHLIIAP
jgi:hypothetical protein